MLIEKTLFGTVNKIQTAIDFLKDLEPAEGYYLAFSGGKDSIIIKHLADQANIKYKAYYNVTTIDPPELIYFIKKYYPDVIWNRPEKHLLEKMLEKKFPPLRQQRWCCQLYKENGGTGKIITGIRKAESAKRNKRKQVEFCYRDKSKIYINPILYWSDSEVWEYIKKYKLEYCSLYDDGWKRIGCLFCPAANSKQRLKEVEKYPGYKKLFIKYFEKLIQLRKKDKLPIKNWKTGADMFDWWIREYRCKDDSDQGVLFE